MIDRQYEQRSSDCSTRFIINYTAYRATREPTADDYDDDDDDDLYVDLYATSWKQRLRAYLYYRPSCTRGFRSTMIYDAYNKYPRRSLKC